MPKLSFKYLTDYLIFLTLSFFSGVCLYLFSVMIISRLQGDQPSASVPWTTLQVAFVVFVIPFIGRRIYHKVVLAGEEVVLPRIAGWFVGALRGALWGGALLTLGCAALLLSAPEKLFEPPVKNLALAVIVISVGAGACYPPVQISRKFRLWLLIALIAQFVMISAMRNMLGLSYLRIDYSCSSIDAEKMPMLSAELIARLLPPDARDIRITGRGGLTAELRGNCKTDLAAVKLFAENNNYKLPEKTDGEFAFSDNKIIVFIFDPGNNTLSFLFKAAGLEEHLIRK